MMRSLYSGVSGMQNHQTRMDVIGNNISNVNTTGFKRGRVNFQDLLSQQMSGAAKPTDELGGVNPKEVGLGMNIASIDTIHTQGSLQTTGVQTDVAIQGNGFFMMKAGEKSFYTRAGTFGLDNEGTLVNPANGMRVQGWMAQDIDGQLILNTSAQPEDLVIPVGSKIDAKATSMVNYACNLDKRLPEIQEGASQADILMST
ncbi:MAG TPA: flagellar hook-basal body complex protein, partial [Treponemataceae bacterium]|nr:flagellar hook-basal body complex protein [Treponemataceae bacterium]